MESFKNFAEQHEREYLDLLRQGAATGGLTGADVPSPPSLRSCIQLAACAKDQLLPMAPELPADLFSSCLTTPIKVALRWLSLIHI